MPSTTMNPCVTDLSLESCCGVEGGQKFTVGKSKFSWVVLCCFRETLQPKMTWHLRSLCLNLLSAKIPSVCQQTQHVADFSYTGLKTSYIIHCLCIHRHMKDTCIWILYV